MRAWLVALLTVTLAVGGLSVLQAQGMKELPPDPEPCPRGSLGPYRGRVVALPGERPLEGALVVFAWETPPDAEGDWATVFVREVLTGPDGSFVVDVPPPVSAMAPRPCGPRMLVYKMGYVSLPRELGLRFGVSARRLVESHGVIALALAKNGEEWAEALHVLYATFGSENGGLRGNRLTRNMFQHSQRMHQESMQFFMDDAPRNPGFWGLEEGKKP